MVRKSLRRRRHKPRFKRGKSATSEGAEPSLVASSSPVASPTIIVTAYGPEAYEERQVGSAADCGGYLGRFPVVWVDVDGLDDARLIRELGELFHLHPLALEDVVHVHQRAKVEPYAEHLFVVARLAEGGEVVDTEQISMFIGPNYVLTFQERPGDSFRTLRQRLKAHCANVRTAGPDHLAYVILDAVIDSYFPLTDCFADRLDALEDQVAIHQGMETVDAIHQLRNHLVLTRRSIRPHREMVHELIRDPHPLITDATRVFLRDCYDHTVQVVELLEVYHDICSDLRDYYLSMVGIRMNQIMKVLTIIATVFMPLSFIAGVFGMNFDTREPWNMPELRWPFGYLYAWGLMLTVAGTLIWHFYRRGWLRPEDA